MNSPDASLQQLAMQRANLAGRLRTLHQVVGSRYPFVSRVALALYDPKTDLLTTFASSNDDGQTLDRHQARLALVPSLLKLAKQHAGRVVDEIDAAFPHGSTHSNWLKSQRYHSSYTLPVMNGQELAAFLFFDSKQAAAFTPEVTQYLDVFADIISQLLLLRMRAVRTLVGMVRIASGLARVRDVETGQHLERMAQYSHLIARGLPASYGLSDEYIEYLRLFAPLHDIGKVGIPDTVLLKPAALDAAEWALMRNHVDIGLKLVDLIIESLGLQDDLAAQVMRNIVGGHQERGDGSGYPAGLLLSAIPLEARIVAVADVYDALASRRPYKEAWDDAQCMAELQLEARAQRLDADCVAALQAQATERQQIRIQYADA